MKKHVSCPDGKNQLKSQLLKGQGTSKVAVGEDAASVVSGDVAWMWIPSASGPNQYVDFVTDMTLAEAPSVAILRACADSDFNIWINGRRLPLHQFPCYPERPVVQQIDVSEYLRPGCNRMAVLAYHRGVDGFNYRLGPARLMISLQGDGVDLRSGCEWLCRTDPCYRSGATPSTTAQLGFTVDCDLRRNDGWNAAFQDDPPVLDGEWIPSVVVDPGPLLELRVNAVSDHETASTAKLEWLGEFLRPEPPSRRPSRPSRFLLESTQAPAQVDSVAMRMDGDFLRGQRVAPQERAPWTLHSAPDQGGTGLVSVFNFGGVRLGHIQLEVEAPAGTVVEMAHGEHLDDLRVRVSVGDRHFADRFVCRDGLSVLRVPFRRLGARFLQVQLGFPKDGGPHEAVIRRLDIIEAGPRREVRGTFESPDRLMESVREAALRTVALGMHGAFSDCPWREQSLYAYDCRSSAMFNYYSFGDYRFPEESLRLLGWGQRADGLLELCAPARVPVTIPVFSLSWICAVCEHHMFSGSEELLREFRPVIERVFRAFLDRIDPETGLSCLFEGDDYWAFYEWAPALDFKNGKSFGEDGKFRLDAPHNLMLVEALDIYARSAAFVWGRRVVRPWEGAASRLRGAIRGFFLDERAGALNSFGDHSRRWHFSATVQAMGILTGVFTPNEAERIRPRLLKPEGWHPMSISTLWYGLRALAGCTAPELQASTYEHVVQRFGRMVMQGSTTLWETDGGADDFDLAGSLCHGWSAVPLWFTQACVLGVTPTAPGFRRFRLDPQTAALPCASGAVPTPTGLISVEWSRAGAGTKVQWKAPDGVFPTRGARRNSRGRVPAGVSTPSAGLVTAG